ncbi:MAG TPA: hypothetical protein PL151_15640 [Phycisphaerae bacterium]|nr:hypothetical protein [Phycisphaerae bacterium]HOJ73327.1 hypothetical protein [Phycisphaerae bacterium]HOM51107.1 hypothetical protein [Phycisphaerae bacterium]HON67516.1 hypothetical protein [Phycisphaerae bacterium]HOQ86081.1 hypothetical protein [Phycisphaerae bacterium]
MSASAHDARETYCRMLGHAVPFRYCRAVADGLPCRRVADCWYTQFDVTAWLTEHFTAEQIARITAPPPPKLTSILEIIQKVRAEQG